MGVLYWKLDTAANATGENKDVRLAAGSELEAICRERSYKNQDVITCSKACLEDYDNKLKMFFREHLHEDEEIRYILEGTGYLMCASLRPMDGCVLRWSGAT